MIVDKYSAELSWWLREVADVLLPWYREQRLAAWGHLLPKDKVTRHGSEWKNAIATMAEVQVHYYRDRLRLDPTINRGRLLDVGSGPMLPARHLVCDELWCLDPLLPSYAQADFPIHDAGAVLLPFAAENIWTIPADFFDTIISVNALDHVDDFTAVVYEIERVAKPTAMIRLELIYHCPTPTEPVVLHDLLVGPLFRRFPVKLISHRLDDQGLVYAIWSNDYGFA